MYSLNEIYSDIFHFRIFSKAGMSRGTPMQVSRISGTIKPALYMMEKIHSEY